MKNFTSFFTFCLYMFMVWAAFSCQKDRELESEDTLISNRGFNALNGDDSCLDQIDESNINVDHRAQAFMLYYYVKPSMPLSITRGIPNWKAALTDIIVDSTTYTVIPLENATRDSVINLFMVQSISGNHSFSFIPRGGNYAALTIYENAEVDISTLFELCECLLYCNRSTLNNIALRGDGGTECWNGGSSGGLRDFLRRLGHLLNSILTEMGEPGNSGGGIGEVYPGTAIGFITGSFGGGMVSNNSGNGSGTGGGGTIINEETAIDLIAKYQGCLTESPDISTAVWQKQFFFRDDIILINKILDEALSAVCELGGAATLQDFDEEYQRALCYYFDLNFLVVFNSPLFQNASFRASLENCLLPGNPSMLGVIETLVDRLSLDELTAKWLINDVRNANGLIATELNQFLASHPNDQNAEKAARIALLAQIQNSILDLDSQANRGIWFSQNVNCCPDEFGGGFSGWVDAPDITPYSDMVMDEIVFLREEHPTWSNFRLRVAAEYNVLSNGIHTMLDICGLSGLASAPCDIVNGVFYIIENEGANATLSFAAALPGGAFISAARLLKVARTVNGVHFRLIWKEIGGKVVFSHHGTYRRIWNTPSHLVGHHMIPQKFWDHQVLQKAARANPNQKTPFHMNAPENGYNISPSRHSGSHSNYSDRIEQRIEQWHAVNPNATPEQTAEAIGEFQVALRNFLNSTTGNINNLTNFPVIPNP